ncbi:unnamed protein product, partial [Onchocerca flexuosa]|uniref:RUN domain-containing protein n=1 Tax=Onchocerca flexuosa TaxID=387005 RepID=A0A183HWV4_9BILA
GKYRDGHRDPEFRNRIVTIIRSAAEALSNCEQRESQLLPLLSSFRVRSLWAEMTSISVKDCRSFFCSLFVCLLALLKTAC